MDVPDTCRCGRQHTEPQPPLCRRCGRAHTPPPRPAGLPDNGYLGLDRNGSPCFDDNLYEPVRGMGDITGLCFACLQLTCPDCHQRFTQKAGHCRGGRYGGCCRSFASSVPTNGSDPHRVGGRCLTDDELLERGWGLDPDGMWVTPQGMRDRARGFDASAVFPQHASDRSDAPREGSAEVSAP